MALPDTDLAYLADRKIPHEVTEEGGMICVVLPGWALPGGYDRPTADVLLRLQPGYPDIAPDMWWFDPPVRRADGSVIPATEVMEQHLGKSWQRWSRHLQPGQWHSGIDGLESFIALIGRELVRCAAKAAA